MSRGAWRIVQATVGLVVLFFIVRQFAINWTEIRSSSLAWRIRPGYLLLSAGLTWAMYGVLIASWRRFLLDWDQPISLATAARIWAVSSLGKYVPGKIWAIAGMAIMAQRAGVTPWAATTSAILMQGLAVGSGVMVVGVAGTAGLEEQYPWIRLALWLLALASAVGVAILVYPPITARLVRRVAPAPIKAPRGGTIIVGIAANLIAWVGYGVAFWILAAGTLPGLNLPVGAAIGAFTASYLAGLLALLMPGGLVIREGFIVLMLQHSIGLAPATALAVASRLLLTLTEVGIAIPFLFFPREKARATT
jgi:glycosyltransferase 2 family protein